MFGPDCEWPIVPLMPLSPTMPGTGFPGARSNAGRNGTSVKSRERSIAANRTLARSIGRR
jgi:hypothetical protein